MNILFIGNYRENTGWALASRDYIRALSTIGNITIRNVYLSSQNLRDKIVPQYLIELENNKYENYDIVIQKTLPHLYAWDGRFKQNIGLTVFETELTYHNWLYRMSMMDKMFVPSSNEQNWISKKIKTPVFNIGEPIDTTAINQSYEPIDNIFKDKNIFKFLFVGENIPRKGLMELVRAYLSEFSVNDNVLLVIKTNHNILEQVNHIKRSIRRFVNDTKYPDIFLIFDKLQTEKIYSLHQYSDVFVMPSYGEAFNRPAATSLLFGKPVITTKGISIDDYMSEDVGWFIDSTYDRVYCQSPPLPDIYKTNEFYHIPNVNDLMIKMREAYQNKDLYITKCENIQKNNFPDKFSYKTIGNNMLRAINV